MADDLRVLVVDDRLVNRVLLSEIFTRLGCCVCLAEDGAQALSLLAVDRFDLVCLDRRMPGLSGDAVAERLPAEQFVLAWSTDLAGLSPRFNGVLPKPVSIAAVQTAIARALQWRSRPASPAGPAALAA